MPHHFWGNILHHIKGMRLQLAKAKHNSLSETTEGLTWAALWLSRRRKGQCLNRSTESTVNPRKQMPQSRTSCLPAEGTVENAAMIFFRGQDAEKHSSALPTTPTGRHMYFRVMNVKLLCLLCEIPHPEGSYESWPVAGLINNERPGLGQTENKCHHARLSSHCSKKNQHTAISYPSRQLCLRRCFEETELAFYHAHKYILDY